MKMAYKYVLDIEKGILSVRWKVDEMELIWERGMVVMMVCM